MVYLDCEMNLSTQTESTKKVGSNFHELNRSDFEWGGDYFFLLLLNVQQHVIESGNMVGTEARMMRILHRKKQTFQI